jgi:hypothetical protein
MARKKRRVKDTPEAQHKRFIETAKEAGADESPDAMDKAFKKINPRLKVSRDSRLRRS